MKITSLDNDYIQVEFNKTKTKVLAKRSGSSFEIKGLQLLGQTYLESSYLLILPSKIREWAGDIKLVKFIPAANLRAFLQDWCIELFCRRLSILKLIGIIKQCNIKK